MKQDYSVAIIPARGNSKGIPKKNLYTVCGKPLLYYTITAAFESRVFDEIIVSSECDEVLAYASIMGATTSKRDEFLSRDEVHSIHVILDYIRSCKLSPDIFITMLLPTSPLRTASDIRTSLGKFKNSCADSLVSVYRDDKHRFSFRRINESGYLEQLFEGNPNVQRQELESLYVVNGSIYVSKVEALLKYKSYHIGNIVPFIMEKRVSIDINTLEDVAEIERILEECG